MSASAAGRPVLVTGGAQGIGLAYARGFAEHGYPVAIADVDERVKEVAKQESDAGRPMLGIAMDVSDPASVDSAVTDVENAFGPVAVLLNNAALFAALPHADWHEIDVELWDRVMAVNVRGPFVCAKRVLPGMYEAGTGRIINVSSPNAHMGGYRRLHYSTSKAAVIGFTRALAREVGRKNITVNAIAPGSTQSEGVLAHYPADVLNTAIAMRSIPRAQVPEDLVGTALFLASEDAGFITGQTIIVDGGQTVNA